MTAELTAEFETFVRTATGHTPYPYQARLAAEGLPTLLRVPTGGGKTVASVLPWLYRRLVTVPQDTPRRLVLVLPQRSIADQTFVRVGEWLERLGLTGEVGLHLLAGGAAQEGGWRRKPEQSGILVGTHDMVLSRALMRGYADWRPMAPVSYGLLHTDTQWVFDELHLLGPALSTSVRLQRLRDRLGTAAATRTMWTSSTRDPAGLGEAVLGSGAPATLRRVARLDLPPGDYVAALTEAVTAAHVPGTRTVVVLNSLERARAVHAGLAAAGREVLLLHSYFRAADRHRLLAATEGQRDHVVVATPALEAGLDLSGRTLVTELAPWASLVQRAGRCNRYGEHPEGGDVLWCTPPEGGDPATARWLTAHEGRAVTPAQLQAARIDEPVPPPGPGRADLLALFDTAPDSDTDSDSDSDTDSAPDTETPATAVDRWICEPSELTALVAWRAWEPTGPAEDEPDPAGAELCPVPLGELQQLPAGRAWLRDALDGRWRPALPADLRPGARLLLDARSGGYLPDRGWTPRSPAPVPPEAAGPERPAYGCTTWVSLDQHLQETADEAHLLLAALPELPAALREAVIRAARYHDLGKCHDAFQEKLRAGRPDPPDGLLAKSRNGAEPLPPLRPTRPYFRHELVSALLLRHGGHDPLVTYLAAAHHGHVRITVRPRGDEAPLLLGVADGDRTPPVELSTGERFPARTLHIATFPQEWTERALSLRDDPDLGPFRLAFLETLVRVADWRSSARHDGPLTWAL
ncbi:CRISPR-associated endonuclease Cas3'' [Kitasatospora aureofaciens]|uniref:type I-G CRISPR-associated helicase/endonuclease Cas3g n=1 Tax=Kitasatospora aureofaciens TaxID=1894 RepID=UPI001C46B77B|nr:CRISPR-associated endonuclease Cas3'' [Kitasatospora aureofaciens]MBV6700374.1 CRISPR-associated endonuclease Cas3'' [Kitasatospora aureofaciens]